jgi:hypothetical protein
MGKKNRRTRNAATLAPTDASVASTTSNNATPVATFYPSDGPSDVELLQTKSSSLQAKLEQLTQLGMANDRAGFVQQFVPLDLSPADATGYLQELTTHAEADGTWNNLVAEIAAMRCGKGVDRIAGDQVTRAIFYFSHPLLTSCDREVVFVCLKGEWRAEG